MASPNSMIGEMKSHTPCLQTMPYSFRMCGWPRLYHILASRLKSWAEKAPRVSRGAGSHALKKNGVT